MVPMPMPATEAVMIIREGEARLADFWRRGANLGGGGVGLVGYGFVWVKRGRGGRYRRGREGAIERGSAQSNGIKNTFYVQVHYFCECAVGMGVEFLAPGSARVGEQDIYVVGRLADFGD